MAANKPAENVPSSATIRPMRMLLKALALFILVNLLFAAADPLPWLGRLSAYNVIFPGRERLPYGDHPERAYNVSVLNLDAMFASHEIAAGPKPPGEFRVLLIGDSSTWGWLLKPGDTLASQINRANLKTADGRTVRAYNLGYPILSLAKDVLIIDRAATEYQPDAVVWLVTLESFPPDKQLFHPLLQNNPGPTRRLIERYGLEINPNDPRFVAPSFWDRTLIGRRRDLADLLRLQIYGAMWAATGIDQDYPSYEPAAINLDADPTFHTLKPPTLNQSDLAFDALDAGVRAIGKTPFLIVNEPILISNGANSDIRYDFFYPRWAYDQYRAFMTARAAAGGWHYLDLWNLIPMDQFTNSAVHYTPAGAALLADHLKDGILQLSKISAP
ncbi:MAG: hypothetical protein M1434_00610 [Chloroflexi bacterium]|nr:hypothetical protein [Chloroflexota bacterium]MCL5273234.1 hypothetical protein [Chloroflexota bacterium]